MTLSELGLLLGSPGGVAVFNPNIEFDMNLTEFGAVATLTGSDASNFLFAGSGNDVINALGGNDLVYAGSGNNVVDGGSGNDVIIATSGNDVLMANSGNDIIYAGDGRNTVFGGEGNDILIQGAQATGLLAGGAGSDVLIGSDYVAAAGERPLGASWPVGISEVLIGGSGDDFIDGRAGDDMIIGGKGNDLLNGGSGRDFFIFTALSDPSTGVMYEGHNVVQDFAIGEDFVSIVGVSLATLDLSFTAVDLNGDSINDATFVAYDNQFDGVVDNSIAATILFIGITGVTSLSDLNI